LGKLSATEKLAVIRRLLPVVEPEASERDLNKVYDLIDSMILKLRRHRRLAKDEAPLLKLLNDRWGQLEELAERTFDEWGAEDFRVALRSGKLELRPFTTTSPDALIDLGLAADAGRDYVEPMADSAEKEYQEAILQAVGDKNTYPLFDDLTGDDVVRWAVRNGLIKPCPGAKRRGRHGGLSGDLLQRLPMFERASMAEVLDVRKELDEYLGAFRDAVASSAATIEAAAWEASEFSEEVDLIFRENLGPAVRRIERRVENDRSLKELTFRYGAPLLSSASSMGAFLAGQSALAGLAALAAGLSTVAAVRTQRKELESEQLYFYYRAGRRLGRYR
jgi:hypothetical protein